MPVIVIKKNYMIFLLWKVLFLYYVPHYHSMLTQKSSYYSIVFRLGQLEHHIFSLWVEKLSFLDMRASSPFIYFSAFASTSAMLA